MVHRRSVTLALFIALFLAVVSVPEAHATKKTAKPKAKPTSKSSAGQAAPAAVPTTTVASLNSPLQRGATVSTSVQDAQVLKRGNLGESQARNGLDFIIYRGKASSFFDSVPRDSLCFTVGKTPAVEFGPPCRAFTSTISYERSSLMWWPLTAEYRVYSVIIDRSLGVTSLAVPFPGSPLRLTIVDPGPDVPLVVAYGVGPVTQTPLTAQATFADGSTKAFGWVNPPNPEPLIGPILERGQLASGGSWSTFEVTTSYYAEGSIASFKSGCVQLSGTKIAFTDPVCGADSDPDPPFLGSRSTVQQGGWTMILGTVPSATARAQVTVGTKTYAATLVNRPQFGGKTLIVEFPASPNTPIVGYDASDAEVGRSR
jgi:hypothetical protein